MLYPVRYLFVFTALLWAFTLHAQCPTPPVANAGPDQFLTCIIKFVELSGSSATPGVTYQWTGPAGFSAVTNNPTVTVPGVYTLIVTEPVNGCTATDTVVVLQTPALMATAKTSGGCVSVQVTGGILPYTYTWSVQQGNQSLCNLPAGTYTVTVSDAEGCTATASSTVTTCQIALSTTVTYTDCNTGNIDLNVSGSTGPYSYLWQSGSTTEDLPNVSAGTYRVTVRDVNNCTATTFVRVSPIPDLQLSIAAPCTPNAEIITTVNAAGAPYTFDWGHLPGTNDPQNLSNIAPGTYTVTATGTNGCSESKTIVAPNGTPPVADLTVTNVLCNGANNGIITTSISGGTQGQGYSYIWSNGATTRDMSSLPAGTYTVTVTDANGCTATASATVMQAIQIAVSISVTPVTCFNGNNGTITVSASGGTSGYIYTWSNGATTQNTNSLVAGTYTVTVRDANNCTATASATVTQPAPMQVSVMAVQIPCFGGNSGSLLTTVVGGTSGYTYIWSNGISTPQQQGISAGTYTVTVTDINGCTATATGTVTHAAPVISHTYCDSILDITVKGGLPPYTYQWTGGLTGPSQSLPPGNYGLTVTDANGCSVVKNIWVSPDPTPCTTITGAVRMDSNKNCQPETTETGLGNRAIQAVNTVTGEIFLAMTGPDGRYVMRVIPGTYTVSMAIAIHSDISVCNNSIPASVPQSGNTATADFAVQKVPECPRMTVDITTPRLRRCFDQGNYYTVQYCNNGPIAATNAYIDVALDSFLTFLSATKTGTDLGSNQYRFQLGMVQPGECKFFFINVRVSCDAVLGQSHCTTAHIYPDSTCSAPNPKWSGAQVEASARCTADSLHFNLKNTGKAKMSQVLEYIVIEDGIMARMGQSATPLAAGASMIVSVPANGHTWRIQAQQEPFAPIAKVPALSVEGCTALSSFSTGFLTQFPAVVNGPWEDIDCTANTGAFDPNDKMANPAGFGTRHYIAPNTDIEYKIRFQNTGTDTAFNVVIRDTLSRWLNPASVRPGTSSHPYTFELTGNGVLVFKFPNIMLPDSHINVRASNGFVSYQISQRDSVPLETDIHNRAAIYFDFNDAVMTNATTHRVGTNFVMVRLWEPRRPEYAVRVMPQPMAESARIIVEKVPPTGDYLLRIFDLTGNLVRIIQHSAPQFEVPREALSAGFYLFEITRNGIAVGSGKMVVSE